MWKHSIESYDYQLTRRMDFVIDYIGKVSKYPVIIAKRFLPGTLHELFPVYIYTV